VDCVRPRQDGCQPAESSEPLFGTKKQKDISSHVCGTKLGIFRQNIFQPTVSPCRRKSASTASSLSTTELAHVTAQLKSIN